MLVWNRRLSLNNTKVPNEAGWTTECFLQGGHSDGVTHPEDSIAPHLLEVACPLAALLITWFRIPGRIQKQDKS